MAGPEFIKSQVCVRYILATAIVILLSLVAIGYIYYLEFQTKVALLYAAAIMSETRPDMIKVEKDSNGREYFSFEYEADPAKFKPELSEYDLAKLVADHQLNVPEPEPDIYID